MLVLATSSEQRPAFGFNVDGAAWFDCDSDGLLLSLKINIRRESWRAGPDAENLLVGIFVRSYVPTRGEPGGPAITSFW